MIGELPIYLDYQASTPCDPRVIEEVTRALENSLGNPSSSQHEWGLRQRNALDEARARVADLVGVGASEVVFVSGATEANNLAIRGFCGGTSAETVRRFLVPTTEHPSVIEAARVVSKQGWEVVWIGASSDGTIDLEHLESEARRGAGLISVMAANNELGGLNPIQEVASIAKSHGAVLHTDATQAISHPLSHVDQADLISLSAHKIYGPQGVGALIVRNGLKRLLDPLIVGGGQEAGLRSGTENVPGAIGLGAASEIMGAVREEEAARTAVLRDQFAVKLVERVPETRINGPELDNRLAGNLHITLPTVDADVVIANTPGVAMATGSACASSAPAPSHVLKAIGMPDDEAERSLRLSIGRFTTKSELEAAVSQIGDSLDRALGMDSGRVSCR